MNPRPLIALASLPEGVPTEVTAALDDDGAQSLIVYRQGDVVQAWLNVCPHAGRRLDYAPGQFLLSKAGHLVCAVHGACFELAAGVCVDGPCRGESLRTVPVVIADGHACVDLD